MRHIDRRITAIEGRIEALERAANRERMRATREKATQVVQVPATNGNGQTPERPPIGDWIAQRMKEGGY